METMTVSAITRIAESAARRTAPQLEVIGVTINAGGSDYVEILFDIRGCHRDPCQVVLGVFRNVAEPALESAIADQLRAHVDVHHSDGRAPE